MMAAESVAKERLAVEKRVQEQRRRYEEEKQRLEELTRREEAMRIEQERLEKQVRSKMEEQERMEKQVKMQMEAAREAETRRRVEEERWIEERRRKEREQLEREQKRRREEEERLQREQFEREEEIGRRKKVEQEGKTVVSRSEQMHQSQHHVRWNEGEARSRKVKYEASIARQEGEDVDRQRPKIAKAKSFERRNDQPQAVKSSDQFAGVRTGNVREKARAWGASSSSGRVDRGSTASPSPFRRRAKWIGEQDWLRQQAWRNHEESRATLSKSASSGAVDDQRGESSRPGSRASKETREQLGGLHLDEVHTHQVEETVGKFSTVRAATEVKERPQPSRVIGEVLGEEKDLGSEKGHSLERGEYHFQKANLHATKNEGKEADDDNAAAGKKLKSASPQRKIVRITVKAEKVEEGKKAPLAEEEGFEDSMLKAGGKEVGRGLDEVAQDVGQYQSSRATAINSQSFMESKAKTAKPSPAPFEKPMRSFVSTKREKENLPMPVQQSWFTDEKKLNSAAVVVENGKETPIPVLAKWFGEEEAEKRHHHDYDEVAPEHPVDATGKVDTLPPPPPEGPSTPSPRKESDSSVGVQIEELSDTSYFEPSQADDTTSASVSLRVTEQPSVWPPPPPPTPPPTLESDANGPDVREESTLIDTSSGQSVKQSVARLQKKAAEAAEAARGKPPQSPKVRGRGAKQPSFLARTSSKEREDVERSQRRKELEEIAKARSEKNWDEERVDAATNLGKDKEERARELQGLRDRPAPAEVDDPTSASAAEAAREARRTELREVARARANVNWEEEVCASAALFLCHSPSSIFHDRNGAGWRRG